MNTDQLRNNHKFYNGFEDEDEIVLSLEKKPEIYAARNDHHGAVNL